MLSGEAVGVAGEDESDDNVHTRGHEMCKDKSRPHRLISTKKIVRGKLELDVDK